MMKRVISGVFLLIALGALGLILAGALTSGEQLIVRFLTAIIVAALALYVISDLRLQADDSAVANGPRGGPTPSPVRIPVGGGSGHESPPPNSTAAFMATVTGKRSAVPPSVFDKTAAGHGPVGDNSGSASSWASPVAGPPSSAHDTSFVDASPVGTRAEVAGTGETDAAREVLTADFDPAEMDAEDRDPSRSIRTDGRVSLPATRSIDADLDDLLNPYEQDDEEVKRWPLTAEHKAIDANTLLSPVAGGPAEWASATDSGTPAAHDPDEGTETEASGPSTDDEDAEEALGHLFRPGQPGPVPTGRDHTEPLRIDSPFGRLSAGSALGLLDRPVASPTPEHDDVTRPREPALSRQIVSPTIAAAAYARAPMADIVDLRTRRVPVSSEIETAIRNGEIEVIASLMEQGLLSTDGPISDRDVRTMVYVAFTSAELRKILLAGGTLDGDNSGLDLGEVELFDENRAAPQAALGTGFSPAPDVIDLRGEEAVSYEFDLRSTPASARAL